MIAYLQGKVLHKTAKYIILLTGDIGYQIFLKNSLLEKIKENSQGSFFIHHYVREDSENLYGFEEFSELEMFELLLSISGVGPKAGLGILELAGVLELKQAIALGDITLLTRVSGIGKKTAERLILELRNKVGEVAHLMPSQGEAIEALEALGYTSPQIREALSRVDPHLPIEEKIKKALSL